MKILIVISIIVIGSLSLADTKPPTIKSWKTFRSDWGFEFKYPDCWKVEIGNINFEAPLEKAFTLAVEEQSACERPSFNPGSTNGIGFDVENAIKNDVRVAPMPKNVDAQKRIQSIEESAKIAIDRKEWLVFKKVKLGTDDAEAWVENLPDVDHKDIRWKWTIFCPAWWVNISGPHIRNPDKSYLEKFKSGDLALPEPEKTIIESFRCTKPKLKPGVKIPLSH